MSQEMYTQPHSFTCVRSAKIHSQLCIRKKLPSPGPLLKKLLVGASKLKDDYKKYNNKLY